MPPARPPGCANPKASKEFVVLDQAHHRSFIGTFCDQTKAVGSIAKADPNAVCGDRGADRRQRRPVPHPGHLRARDGLLLARHLLPAGRTWSAATTATTPAAGGFCITPATVAPAAPCNETGAVPHHRPG